MKTRPRTPVTPSPFLDGNKVEEMAAAMGEPATRSAQQQLKENCLERDNFQCMLTGITDISAPKHGRSIVGYSGRTIPSHIIPFSLGCWDNNEENQEIARIWTTLRRCFPCLMLQPKHINNSANLMTLSQEAHSSFGAFELAFDPTGEPNEYEIFTFPGYPTILDLHMPQPNMYGKRIIKFTSYSDAELPSSVVLQIHATLSKILHASGMGKHIDDVMRERDRIRGLSSDGSTDISRLLFAF